MLSDDVFRRAFERVSDYLVTWADAQQDAAAVEHDATDAFLRVRLLPHAPTACPVEVMLHRQSQTYDVQFGTADTWEDLPAGDDPDRLASLLQAVVEGRIVMRTLTSAGTGIPLSHAVIVSPHDGAPVSFERSGAWQPTGIVEGVQREKHWAAYRRP